MARDDVSPEGRERMLRRGRELDLETGYLTEVRDGEVTLQGGRRGPPREAPGRDVAESVSGVRDQLRGDEVEMEARRRPNFLV